MSIIQTFHHPTIQFLRMKKLKLVTLCYSLVSSMCAAEAGLEYPTLSQSTCTLIEQAKPSCRKIGGEGVELSTHDYVLITLHGRASLYQVSFGNSAIAGFKQPQLKLFGEGNLVVPTENISSRTDTDGTKIYSGFADVGERVYLQAKLKPGNLNWTASFFWGENSSCGNPGSTTSFVDIKGNLPPPEFRIQHLDLKNLQSPILIVHCENSNVVVESSTDLQNWEPLASSLIGIQSTQSCAVFLLTPPCGGFGTQRFFRVRK